MALFEANLNHFLYGRRGFNQKKEEKTLTLGSSVSGKGGGSRQYLARKTNSKVTAAVEKGQTEKQRNIMKNENETLKAPKAEQGGPQEGRIDERGGNPRLSRRSSSVEVGAPKKNEKITSDWEIPVGENNSLHNFESSKDKDETGSTWGERTTNGPGGQIFEAETRKGIGAQL